MVVWATLVRPEQITDGLKFKVEFSFKPSIILTYMCHSFVYHNGLFAITESRKHNKPRSPQIWLGKIEVVGSNFPYFQFLTHCKKNKHALHQHSILNSGCQDITDKRTIVVQSRHLNCSCD